MTESVCQHANVELLSPWELLRKFVCADCDAVLTCACARDIAFYVVPHQALRGVDADTRLHVPVTHPLTDGICFDCRNVLPPANPTRAHRGAASVIHRYYWHELRTRTHSRFLDWCRAQDLALFRSNGHSRYDELVRAHRDDFDRIEADVLKGVRAWHASEPRYDVSRPSDGDVLNAANVEVRNMPASYLTPSPQQKVMVVPVGTVDPSSAVTVEEFVTNAERSRGRQVLPLESRPVQCLFGAMMWMWVSDVTDPRCRASYVVGRDGVGADEHALIPFLAPDDFGSSNHARRRAHTLAEHLAFISDDLDEMLSTYDFWLDPSRSLRQYLWAYKKEDEDRARALIAVFGTAKIKEILEYLAADYWQRYLGWPDLLTWKQEGPVAVEPILIEVKSSGDRLSEDQRTWITLNNQTLQLPFHIVKVHRTERLLVEEPEAQ